MFPIDPKKEKIHYKIFKVFGSLLLANQYWNH